MDKAFSKIFDVFDKSMQELGVYVGQPIQNENWKGPSHFYSVMIGLYKLKGGDLTSHLHIVGDTLNNNQGHIQSWNTISTVKFRMDRSTQSLKEKKPYELMLPGQIRRPAVSLQAMEDGVNLLKVVDAWAENYGTLTHSEKGDSEKGIEKIFKLNVNKILNLS